MRTVRKEPLPNGHLIVMEVADRIMITDTLTARFGHGATIAAAIADHQSQVENIIRTDSYWRDRYREAGDECRPMYDMAYAEFARAEMAVSGTMMANALGGAILAPASRLMVWLADKTRAR